MLGLRPRVHKSVPNSILQSILPATGSKKSVLFGQQACCRHPSFDASANSFGQTRSLRTIPIGRLPSFCRQCQCCSKNKTSASSNSKTSRPDSNDASRGRRREDMPSRRPCEGSRSPAMNAFIFVMLIALLAKDPNQGLRTSVVKADEEVEREGGGRHPALKAWPWFKQS